MYQHVINASQSAWKTAKRCYHMAAFLSLAFVIFLIATHRISGYTQANVSFGQDSVAEQLQAAAEPLPDKFHKIADASPRPAEKPQVPTKTR
jgi:hypothetical protein